MDTNKTDTNTIGSRESGHGTRAEPASTGRGYMQRRQLERDLDEEVRRLAAECVEQSHERLRAAALDGRLNPLHQPEWAPDDGEIVLNGAYLVRTEQAHLHYGDEAAIAAVDATVPLGRMGEPADVADACLFLASPLNTVTRGAVVQVYGQS